MVDASRVGPDADREKIRQAIPSALRAYPLHDRWFAIDGDSYYTGTDIANISRIEGSWPLVRTWLSMTGLSCGNAITSDPWYWQDFKPYWRNVEILTPPARERTEVMDLGTGKEWTRLLGKFRREWGISTVALLWNPGDTERTVTLDFAKAGMDPKARHAVWSFWDDRYLGVAQGSWTTPRLGPGASQHLVFTPLPEKPGKPVLIGSNLHIYCGAAEIKQVESSRSSFAVELTDAGARDGELYLYCAMQPVLSAESGCAVSGITSAGENVWRVSLHDRMSGARQRVDMKILLPVSLQPWFWTLIATAVASLVFAAWRYVVGLRLERARSLDQERARIARDIHDDLGASLTHIALLGELARNEIDNSARTRTHVDDIFRAASKLTRSVDEIVWALNPSNDTIVRFAAYVGDFAQDFVQSAGVDCRLSIPADLPDHPLPPKTRHALFLVIKEALHNIVSHSQAACVNVGISFDRGVLRVSIHDDGRGFDSLSAAPSRPGGGHGLANMRQRIKEVGGALDIASEPGHGATVTIEIHV
jgi:signal transduction histidine kinase